ncbi:MAG: T9SS type A sorting domain-containing protein, partial [Chlorobi bacterium]|nr:T9SS type A sorting domain-containing protein [Chlorobiota bacterium]
SNKKPRYSKPVEYYNDIPEITFIPGNGNSTTNRIFFSEETRFEIYDYYGKLVKTGYGQEINVEKLKKGTYFLNYDNKTENFIKK